MKEIIAGKVYNTDTARLQGEYGNSHSISDFRHVREDLYLKKTGEFFLHGAGGPMSKYAEPLDNGWTGSEEIIPLTYDEAKEWAEAHLEADEYEAIFGPVSEGDGEDIPFHVYIPSHLMGAMAKTKAKTGKSYKDIITEALENSLGGQA